MAYEFTPNPDMAPCIETLKADFNRQGIAIIQETATTITTESIKNFNAKNFPEWLVFER